MSDNSKNTIKENKAQVIVRLTPEQKRRLRIVVAAKNQSISDWMGNLIDEAYESLDDQN